MALHAAAQTLTVPFDERFSGISSPWKQEVSPGGTFETKDGISFKTLLHARAHVERTAGTDLITLSGKLSRWGSIYLVWGPEAWCAVGQVSPTPFGRIYSTLVTKGKGDETDHRGIHFPTPRWLRIRLGENYIRFDYSQNGTEWLELRTVERPKEFSGAPKLMAAGKYYEVEDRPFASAPPQRKYDENKEITGRILELHAEATPQKNLKLSAAELKKLREPKVDPVMALLNQSKDDPSYEKIVGFYPPMKYPREVVGVAAHPLDIGVDYLGRLDVSPWTKPVAWFEVGNPGVPLGKEGAPFQRRLQQGYLPIDTLTTSRDGVEYELTVFGWSDGFSVDKPLFAYTRLTAKSTGGKLPQQVALVSPDKKRHAWQMTADGNQAQFCLQIQYPDTDSAKEIKPEELQAKLDEVASRWKQRLAPVARFDVPDTRVMEAYRAWVAYSMLNADTINGYVEPHDGAGFYEEMFGNSVSLHTIALDQYGLHDYAAQILDTQIHFQQANGLYTQVCGLTDPGGFLVGLARHYRMTGDRKWLERVKPNIIKQLDWLMREKAATPKEGVTRGLIKFRPYNDYSEPVFNYLGNVWCAKGMEDAAAVLKELGLPESEKYAAEAKQYRQDILDSMEAAAFMQKGQTLLPLEPDTHRLLKLEKYQGGSYYGLNVGPLLGIGLLSEEDKRTTWLVDAFEKRGGMIAGVAEFQGGIDHAYTYGYLLNELKRGEVRKTLLGFWSMLAFGMTRDTYSPVEVSMIETGENHFTLPHLYSCTDQLRLLRTLLLREEKNVLHLGEGIPRAWLEPGKHVAVNAAPTEFGEVSYRIDAQPDGSAKVTITPPSRQAPQEIRLHLRHPGQKSVASVKAAGVDATYSGETVVLRNVKGPVELQVEFGGK